MRSGIGSRILACALAVSASATTATNYQPEDLVRLEPMDVTQSEFSRFGEVLAAYGGTLLVAAPGDRNGQGAVYVYERRSTVQWDQTVKILSPEPLALF